MLIPPSPNTEIMVNEREGQGTDGRTDGGPRQGPKGSPGRRFLSFLVRGIGNVCDRDKIGGSESGGGRVRMSEISATLALQERRKCIIADYYTYV